MLCWIEIFEFVFEIFKHFPIILKQTSCALQAIRLYSHSASHDGWHVKYFCFLLKNISSFLLLRGSYLWCKATCPCWQTNQNHLRRLWLSDAIIVKASTGHSMPTIVIAETQGLLTCSVLIQTTNVQLHSLNNRTYELEYCKNMLFPTLVRYVTMLVTFVPMAWTMNHTFITFYALNHINSIDSLNCT